MLPKYVTEKMNKHLWRHDRHPLGIICKKVDSFFRNQGFSVINDHVTPNQFQFINDPFVTVKANFDDLLIPSNHPSRSPSDTFYVEDDDDANLREIVGHSTNGFRKAQQNHLDPSSRLLRTHGTAHQSEILRSRIRKGIWTVDVFRKDEVNATHSSVFHQTDGFSIWTADDNNDEDSSSSSSSLEVKSKPINDDEVVDNLHASLNGLMKDLLGSDVISQRWSSDYFPFTHPSFELEIQLKQSIGPYNGQIVEEKWMEVLGCGVIKPEILRSAGLHGESRGWAFGMGLDRLVMAACQIPDIRLLWSEDPRFTDQFEDGKLNAFRPFSCYPETVRDVSVWFPLDSAEQECKKDLLTRAVSEIVAEEAPEVVQSISVRDHYREDSRESFSWRVVYQAFDRTLTHEEVNSYQNCIVDRLRGELNWEVR